MTRQWDDATTWAGSAASALPAACPLLPPLSVICLRACGLSHFPRSPSFFHSLSLFLLLFDVLFACRTVLCATLALLGVASPPPSLSPFVSLLPLRL